MIKAKLTAKPKLLFDKFLKMLGGKALAEMEAELRDRLATLKNTSVIDQKFNGTAVAHGQHGTVYEMEQRGLITTSINPAGLVEWSPAKPKPVST